MHEQSAEVITFVNVGKWKKYLAHSEKLQADEILIHISMTINLLPR